MRTRNLSWLAGLAILIPGAYAILAGLTGTLFLPPLEAHTLAPPSTLATQARALLGLLTALTFPGLLLALCRPESRPREAVSLLLQTLGFSTASHLVSLCLLRVLNAPRTPLTLLGCATLLASLVILWRRADFCEGSLKRPSRHFLAGALACVGLSVGLSVYHRAYLVRELDSWWYSPDISWENIEAQAQAPRLESQGIRLSHPGPWQKGTTSDGYPFFRLDTQQATELTLTAVTPREVSLRLLFQGPVGSALRVDCEDAQLKAPVEKAPLEAVSEGPTLRYLDRGLVWARLTLTVRETRTCRLEPVGLGTASSVLLDVTDMPLGGVEEAAARQGWVMAHYYQILNIAENVEWARQTLEGRWVTLNQPPLWSYLYATLLVYVGTGLWAVNLFFFALLGMAAFVAVQLAATETEDPPVWLWAVPLLMGISHARIITTSGSSNFPDNLYAFALLATLYSLTQGRALGVTGAGMATTMLRYPGSTLTFLAGCLTLWLYPTRRRLTWRAGLWWGLTLAGTCAAFLVVGGISGQLEGWVEILHFETLPEHFHDQYDPRELLKRPAEFWILLLTYTGGIPLLGLISRSRLTRLVGLLGLTYTFFLCFIDHFPTHYFLPFLWLSATMGTASLASLSGWKRWVVWLACVLGVWWGFSRPV